MAPESSRAKSSSSSVHHALSDTDTAPIDVMAAKAMTHSGKLRMRDGDPVAGLHAVALDERGAEGVHVAPTTSAKLQRSSS